MQTSVADVSDIIIPDSASEGDEPFPSAFPRTDSSDSRSGSRFSSFVTNSSVLYSGEENEDYITGSDYPSDPDYVDESDSDDDSGSEDDSDEDSDPDNYSESDDGSATLPVSRSRQPLMFQLSNSGSRIEIKKPGKYDKDVIVHLSMMQASRDGAPLPHSRPAPLYNHLAPNARTSLSFGLEALSSMKPQSFYALIDEAWRARDNHLYRAKMFNYMLWVKDTLGPDACFSGIHHACPDANLTEMLQINNSLADSRNSMRARYDRWKLTVNPITLGSQKATKSLCMTQKLSLEDFQHILTGMYETSHLCNFSRCMNPLHMTAEPHSTNIKRSACFKDARLKVLAGQRLPRECSQHDPPCLLQTSTFSIEQITVMEHEALGESTPPELPRQVQVQAPGTLSLLQDHINIYKWEGDKRTKVKTIRLSSQPPKLEGTMPQRMHYSKSLWASSVARVVDNYVL